MMRYALTIFILWFLCPAAYPQNAFKLYFNEIRANDSGTDDGEFIELIGPAGTDLAGFQIIHYNGSDASDGGIWTHTIGAFTIPDDGIIDNDGTALGFYVLGATSVTNVDESDNWTNDRLQNGPDGLVLYDNLGNILDAFAWEGAGDMAIDDPGTLTTEGSTSADNYLHVALDDDAGDNSLQAPNDVLGDSGSGWTLAVATPGALNGNQISGDISLPVQLSSFTARAGDRKVILEWITQSEKDNVGFELLRSDKKDGDYQIIASYINNDKLRGQLNSNSSHLYTFTDALVVNGHIYWYQLADVDLSGKKNYHGPVAATPRTEGGEVINQGLGDLPGAFALYPNFPNPFNPSTRLNFDVPQLSQSDFEVSIVIYNALGQTVRSLYRGNLAPGKYEMEWHGRDENGFALPGGVYFAMMQADVYRKVVKMVLIR
jgi:hypothetical protein